MHTAETPYDPPAKEKSNNSSYYNNNALQQGQAGEEFLYDTLQKRPLARFVERPYSEVEYHRPYDYFVDYKNDETACPL
jgi:hypothetical protein